MKAANPSLIAATKSLSNHALAQPHSDIVPASPGRICEKKFAQPEQKFGCKPLILRSTFAQAEQNDSSI